MKQGIRNIGLIVIMLFVVSRLLAQSDNMGEVNIYADSRIDDLLQLHIAYNETFPVLDGYRIHIFMESGNEALLNAENVQGKFEDKYNYISAYITFGEPYYRVRVGDFRTRLEASQFLQKINRKYPNAWVIKDKINLPSLPKYQ